MSGDGGSTTFRFNPRNADEIFSEFFGFSSPFGGMGDTGSGGQFPRSTFDDDIFSQFRGGGGGEGSTSTHHRKGAAIERALACSLEELYKGTTKKMKISRDVLTHASGRPTTVEEILIIEIKPGWKKGTKITFAEKGNEQRGVIPSDLVFIIDEKPHAVFKRDGNDLVVTQNISLSEALTGYTAQLTTLDGRSLRIRVTSVINPTYEEVVKGEGMPIPKEPTKKGNLRVNFNIKFPKRLSDSQKKAIYDQYVEAAGLKGQVPPPGAGGSTPFGFNPRNAEDIFSEFFGTGDTGGSHAEAGGQFSRSMFGDDIFSQFREAGDGEGSSSMSPRKGAAIERALACSLEDLYTGTTKKMKISRDVTDASGRPTTVEEVLIIEIKPGWKKGTKITFAEKGNEQRGVIPSDLVFIIDEKPHAVFKRDDNDLVVTQNISLAEALTGYTDQLTTLDGRSLRIRVSSVISPTYEQVVEGEGMPIPKEPTKKGNLRVKFNIKFPTRLSDSQKRAISDM